MVGQDGPDRAGHFGIADNGRCRGRRNEKDWRQDRGKVLFADAGRRTGQRRGLARFTILTLCERLAYRPAIERGEAKSVEVALQAGGLVQGLSLIHI